MFPAYAHLSAYDRHKKLINDYFLLKGGSVANLRRDTSRDKTDFDIIKENHRFLWEDDDDDDGNGENNDTVPNSWGVKLAKKYYDKLFKEYCICDLIHYKDNKIALRWRIEKEVIVGKGQFECGNKKCNEKENLRSWEVNFGYVEHGEKKNALVKLRLCPDCSKKLNYRSQKREIIKNKSLKRLGKSSKLDNLPSSSTDTSVTVKTEENDVIIESDDNDGSSKQDIDESKIWKEKPADSSEKSREQEFEEYLADLFM